MNLSDPLSGVLDGLPPTQFAMAYGSGVFPQVGYNAAESESSMIDMIVATDDPVACSQAVVTLMQKSQEQQWHMELPWQELIVLHHRRNGEPC